MKKLILLAGLLSCCFLLFADNPHTPRTPVVVAQQTFLNQSGAVPQTVLFTPTANGLFRVSVYLETSTTNQPSGNNFVFFSWTDDFNNQASAMGAAFGVGPGFPTSVNFTGVVYATSGTPISINGTANTTFPYTVYAVVEQL